MEKTNLIIGLMNVGVSLLIIGISIPLIREKVKINKWYGFRISKAFESEEMWFKINKIGGKVLLYYSIPLLLLGTAVCFLPKLDKGAVVMIANAPIIYLVAVAHASFLSIKL